MKRRWGKCLSGPERIVRDSDIGQKAFAEVSPMKSPSPSQFDEKPIWDKWPQNILPLASPISE